MTNTSDHILFVWYFRLFCPCRTEHGSAAKIQVLLICHHPTTNVELIQIMQLRAANWIIWDKLLGSSQILEILINTLIVIARNEVTKQSQVVVHQEIASLCSQ